MASIPMRVMAIESGSGEVIWLAGGDQIRFSYDAGLTWRRILTSQFNPQSQITCIEFVHWDNTQNRYRIAIGGQISYKSSGTYYSGQVVIISHNHAAQPNTGVLAIGSVKITDENSAIHDDNRLVLDLFFNKANFADINDTGSYATEGKLFFCGEKGLLGYTDTRNFDNNGQADSTSATWLPSMLFTIASNTTTDITSIYWYQPAVTNDVLLFTDVAGSLWRCSGWKPAGTSILSAFDIFSENAWIQFIIDGSPVLRATTSGEIDVIMIITEHGLYRGNVLVAERRLPTLISIPDQGRYLLACVNVSPAQPATVEIWRSDDEGLTFHLNANQPDNARWELASGQVVSGRPTLALLDDGSIMLTIDIAAGTSYYHQRVYWSFDSGDTWVRNYDPSVTIPAAVPAFQQDNTNDLSQGFQRYTNDGNTNPDPTDKQASRRRTTRAVLPYGGGPVYAAWQNSRLMAGSLANRIAVYRMYDWTIINITDLGSTITPLQYAVPPIMPGVPRWIGLDDLRVVFNGLPAVRDIWTVNIRYRYDVRNVAVESPSILYRSRNDLSNTDLIWQRDHADVVAVIGAGTRWQVDAFALFGTNFPRCQLRITVPGYASASFPTISPNSSNYIEFALDSIIEFGDFSNAGVLNSVLTDATKSWIPHQWAQAHRTYYIGTYNRIDPFTTIQVVKILDNTETDLIIDTATLGAADAYYIFGDRFFCDGTTGKLGDGTISQYLPDIRGTEYQFTKFLHLRIPTQTTHEGFFQVGSILFGTKTPLDVQFATPDRSRKRFNRGFGWQGNASIQEDTGLSGVMSYEQFGRLRQTWSLSYEYVRWWDRDYFFNALLDRPKKAFGFLFDNINRHSLELVRLGDQPQYRNVSGDYYDFDLSLVEVI